MKERPILFSAPMVRAILEGKKTQTRRVLKKQPIDILPMKVPNLWVTLRIRDPEPHGDVIGCRLGVPGDQLWVRETFVLERFTDEPAFSADRPTQYNPGDGSEWSESYWLRPHYRATDPAPDLCYEDDENDDGEPKCKWRPSIFMPRWASRISLEIVNVRVERVQDITRDNAKAEGVSNLWDWPGDKDKRYHSRGVLNPYVANFSVLWDKINGPRGAGWDINPWVWVVEFRKSEPPKALIAGERLEHAEAVYINPDTGKVYKSGGANEARGRFEVG